MQAGRSFAVHRRSRREPFMLLRQEHGGMTPAVTVWQAYVTDAIGARHALLPAEQQGAEHCTGKLQVAR